MPGQRKRRRQPPGEPRPSAERFAPEAGHWSVLSETRDASEHRAYVRRLRAEGSGIDWSAVRVDTLCGRLKQPTTYRLSLFVPNPVPGREAGVR
ncbi:hypothetical protein [Streptomyces cyaneofuscatus]|uniref:Uncharacterized protein n=1 Tax=Streptomyces cyaneofuscatus TaxID=66883 RepID=A0ABZ1EYW7_9ACTN|nr:hypothetical protein [Streptomyces cyaneofuscatus]WSB09271.1 hypothetical protein OG849_19540 [Streptomyces cyaneofuscatus]WSD47193.1 hypothetical protein OG857_15860 [Streptomyces cyaneofuscatus]WTA90594.1 hypothetical protein OG323_16985 [Streptomyces cyaneofuscatus]